MVFLSHLPCILLSDSRAEGYPNMGVDANGASCIAFATDVPVTEPFPGDLFDGLGVMWDNDRVRWPWAVMDGGVVGRVRLVGGHSGDCI